MSDEHTTRLRWTDGEALDPEAFAGFLGPGGFFELVEEDVLGARLALFANRQRSIGAMVEAAAGHGDRPFLVEGDRTVTFADLPARVAGAAARLAAAGVERGDRVAMAGRPSLDHCLVALGTMARGAVATVLNPSWTADETAHAVDLTAPALAVGEDGPLTFADLLAGPAPEALAPEAVAVDEDDPATVIFTSGTTGRPKGATLSHRNIVHFCWSAAATTLVRRLVAPATSPPGAAGGAGNPPAVIASAPLFHMSGLLGQLVNAVAWGITLVVPPPGRWDASTHLALTERHRVTTWSIVPTQLWRIVEHPDLDRFDLSSLETIGGGGATFPPELLRRTAERLPGVGAGVRVGYGMTEASGTLTLLLPPVTDAGSRLGGRGGGRGRGRGPRPRGARAARPARSGRSGVAAPACSSGYWGNDDATGAVLRRRPLVRHRRLRTPRDRVRRQPVPVRREPAARPDHPGRREHLPDRDREPARRAPGGRRRRGGRRARPEWGEQVKAVVVVAEGPTVDDDDLRDWVGTTLARFKVPTLVERRPELPRTALGKLDKALLAVRWPRLSRRPAPPSRRRTATAHRRNSVTGFSFGASAGLGW